MARGPNPFAWFRERGRVCVLDGGLATTLEAAGADLRDDLWSARLLVDDPEAIVRAHQAFLRAGADCIATASYQASFTGLAARGLDREQVEQLFRDSVGLAGGARDEFWARAAPRERYGRPRPLVAASIGPYGAYLADGSEYRGRYGVEREALEAFHGPRWRVLAGAGADLLACETLPDMRETEVLLQLLSASPDAWAWMSFSCGDGQHLHDGTPVREAAQACDGVAGVAAVGINCTAPSLVSSLVEQLRRATSLPIIVYPNSGEHYDAHTGSWGEGEAMDWPVLVREWIALGVTGIGGCCRMGPDAIATVREIADGSR